METTMKRMGIVLVTTMVATVFAIPAAYAGCGCNKPPPDPAAVRPNVTYAGTEVTLFGPTFVVGETYEIDFVSGTSAAIATVTGTVLSRRDLADAVQKPQLVTIVPNVPLGPTSIQVRPMGQPAVVLAINDAAFTVAPAPIVMPQELGNSTYAGYQAAIGRDGTMYVSLDMSAVLLPRVFRAQAKGYPLVFTSQDVTFYNIQGFLMQLLDASMPGLYSVESADSSVDSDILGYSRHEFSTFYLQHEERQVHQIVDGNWHVDGTRHVDHNHLIVAIAGALYGGALPVPGATPAFDLELKRFSLFRFGLVGLDTGPTAVDMANNSGTDSYDSRTAVYGGHQGEILTNGGVKLSSTATIDGDARAFGFNILDSARVTGAPVVVTTPQSFMTVKVPDFLTDLGTIALVNSQTQTIQPGSYRVASISLSNFAGLYINDCAAPVTIYVTGAPSSGGKLEILNDAEITTCDSNPDKFAVYMVADAPVNIGGKGSYAGVVYAPQSAVDVNKDGDLYGSVVGKTLTVRNKAKLHYDSALKGG